MGMIVSDVREVYLPKHPDQVDMLKPFLSGFDVTYAEEKHINNTTIYAFLLKPEQFMSDAFGIDREILLAYSEYENLQPRSLQAVDILFNTFPFKNRVDSLNCFFVSKDRAVLENAGVTSFADDRSRSIVPFVYDDLLSNGSDNWYIRNILRINFYDVDLFGYTLPLRDESSFFGRQQVVSRYIDAIKRGENRGVFGVRKTGKTSLLFKIDRIVREQKLGFVFFYDCKSPSYRSLHWNELLGEICNNIAKRLHISIRREYDVKNIIKSFRYVVHEAAKRNLKIVIMFDEIEYISFKSPMDAHWHLEFVDFWQTIWSVQSVHRNLVFILSGVNPSVTEIDTIDGIQNPLFSIVQSEYLQGLSEEDARSMIRTLGKRMGIKFEYDAIELLYKQYNGHPMLLRLACSYINRQFENQTRPIIISKGIVERIQEDIDLELAYYFKHVVSEIQQFYPEEYEMFEMLASGQTSDFVELSSMAEYTKHLYNYGLIAKNEYGMPYVKMPVAGRYVALELAKKEKRKSLYKTVEKDKRQNWVQQRIRSIIRDLRQLESAIHATGKEKLFGENSFPEAEKFAALQPVYTEEQFERFMNTCNKCFVEAIDNYGKSIGKKNYFWSEIKVGYPTLFDVLHRIRVYRHSSDHLKLNPDVAQKYRQFWDEDTQGISEESEKYFVVQQRLLENLLTAIQIELAGF
jgi:uncharacterized protein YqgQ